MVRLTSRVRVVSGTKPNLNFVVSYFTRKNKFIHMSEKGRELFLLQILSCFFNMMTHCLCKKLLILMILWRIKMKLYFESIININSVFSCI